MDPAKALFHLPSDEKSVLMIGEMVSKVSIKSSVEIDVMD